jgi:hypothetical protein
MRLVSSSIENIGVYMCRFVPFRTQLVSGSRAAAQIRYDNGSTLLGKRSASREADSNSTASDDRDLSRKVHALIS